MKKETIIKRIIKAGYAKTEEEAQDFLDHAKRYVLAIKEGRMCCIIHSVSNSGMSRVLSFHECSKSKYERGRFFYLQFWSLFDALGFSKAGNNFRVSGCGMDMVFHTNYTIIHQLHAVGIVNKKQCSELSQQTPTVL